MTMRLSAPPSEALADYRDTYHIPRDGQILHDRHLRALALTVTALSATARVRRAGRTVGLVDIDVTDDSGRLVAVGRGTYGARTG